MSFWDGKRPQKENFATKDDIEKLQEEFEKTVRGELRQEKGSTTHKIVKNMGKGIGDIARSLNEPHSKKRPKIARMQERKPPIARETNKSRIAPLGAGIKKGKISYAPED